MSMHQLTCILTARDPLVISKFSGSETSHATLDYVPGSALLGALATVAIDNGTPADSTEFRRAFLLGDVSFGDANPTVDGKPSVPAPRSWATVKGQERFQQGSRSNIFDMAALWRKHHTERQIGHEAQTKEVAKRFDMDEEQARTAKLEDIREGHVGGQSYIRLDHQVYTHTAIDADKRSAKEGQLFSYDAIPGKTQFVTQIRSTDKGLLEWLSKLINEMKVIRVGRSRSTGFGRVEASAGEVESLSLDAPSHTDAPQILTLHSDLVLPHGCNGLKEVLDGFHGLTGCKVVSAWSQTRGVQAFHGKWGMPKNNTPAIVRGSVFLLTVDADGFKALADLCATGLGLRTQEGFGRFSLNHPELHAESLWRDNVRQHDEAGQRDESAVPLKRPESGPLRPAFDRWFAKQVDAFAERLLFSADVSKLIDLESRDLIDNAQPSNSQLNALRMAAAKGGLTEARQLIEDLADRKKQWPKWDNCHVKSHLHSGKTLGFGNYVAALLGVNKDNIADNPSLSAEQWLSQQLESDSLGTRLKDSNLHGDFIERARLAYLDLLLRAIVAKRRGAARSKRVKEATHA